MKKFSELRAGMSPEAQARAKARTLDMSVELVSAVPTKEQLVQAFGIKEEMMQMFGKEFISGSYGFVAVRSDKDRRFWVCHDSDYMWTAVTDDFGHLVQVGRAINTRGY